MRRPTLLSTLTLLSLLCLPGLTLGLPPSFTASLETEATYDDNILRYSDQDIDDFVNGRRSSRYAIETYDDFIARLSATLYWRTKFLAGRTRLRLKYSQRQYAINAIKDYQTISVHLRQRWGENEVQLGYIYLPRFYIRHLPDGDARSGTGSYRSFDFERHGLSLTMRRPVLPSTSAELRFEYRDYDYNEDFDEYDMVTLSIEPGVRQKIGPVDFSGQYGFKVARARGYDEDGESRENSDDSDASYDQHGVGGELNLKLGRLITTSFGVDYHRTYFVTAKSVWEDPYHFDREDTYIRLSPSLTIRLPRRVRLEFSYAFTRRNAFSPVETEIEAVKDYTCNRFGVKLVADGFF